MSAIKDDGTTNQAASTAAAPSGRLSRFLHRLTAHQDTLDAEDLAVEADKTGCAPCRSVSAGESVRVSGRLRSVVYTPNEVVPTLEAELFDGTGSIKLVWLGQRKISGIEPGRHLVVSGRIATRHGDRTIFNPLYELLPSHL